MKKQDTSLTCTMVTVFIAVTAVWFFSFFVVRGLFGAPDNAGIAGDLFGAVGALFSGWAFVGVLWAILLQRKSLQIQHDDLKATLEEMKQTREAHEESADTLWKQMETTRIQTRVDILKTLIDTPLQVRGNSFLFKVYNDHVLELNKNFKKNIEEMIYLNNILKEQKTDDL